MVRFNREYTAEFFLLLLSAPVTWQCYENDPLLVRSSVYLPFIAHYVYQYAQTYHRTKEMGVDSIFGVSSRDSPGEAVALLGGENVCDMPCRFLLLPDVFDSVTFFRRASMSRSMYIAKERTQGPTSMYGDRHQFQRSEASKFGSAGNAYVLVRNLFFF